MSIESLDELVREAWTLTSEPISLRDRYQHLSKRREEVALALARFDALMEHDEVAAALRVEGPASSSLILPLAVATCRAGDEEPFKQARILGELGDQFVPAAIPALRRILASSRAKAQALSAKPKSARDARAWEAVEDRAALALAHLGETDDAERLVSRHPELRAALIPAGIEVDASLRRLEVVADDEDELREQAELLTVLSHAKVSDSVPVILQFLRSGIFLHAADALAVLGDDRAIEPARRMLRETCGDTWDTEIHRLAAEHILRHVAGERLPLDLARRAVRWPIIEYRTNEPEALLLRKMATLALATHGDKADRRFAQAQITSPYRVVREAAAVAFEARKVPPLVAFDHGRIAVAKSAGGVKALLAALELPNAVFLDLVAKELVDEARARATLASFIASQIETKMPGEYNDDVELDADIATYVEIGEELTNTASLKKIFSSSANVWVRTKILGEEAAPSKAPASPQTKGATATRFDAPVSFFPRAKLMALADDVERVAVVCEDGVVIFDPQKTRRIATIPIVGVSAVAISNDGARFAVAHKNVVVVYDANAGTEISCVEASSRVTALALAGNLVAFGTERGALRVVDVRTKRDACSLSAAPGAARGAAFLAAKRCVFLADGKGGRSVLVDVDVTKSKRADVSAPLARRMAVHGRVIALLTEDAVIVHDAKLTAKARFSVEPSVIDIAVERDKSIILQREDNLSRVRLGGKAPRIEAISRGRVDLFVGAGLRLYGITDGSLSRFHDDPRGQRESGAHHDHVKGIAVLPSGELITAGWEGRVLFWPKEGGVARTLFDRHERVDWLAVSPDGRRAYFDDGIRVRCVDVAHALARSEAVAHASVTVVAGGDLDVAEDIAAHLPEVQAVATNGPLIAWGDSGGRLHLVDAATNEELFDVTLSETLDAGTDEIESIVLDDAGHVYVGTEGGIVICVDARSKAILWSRVEHGIDVLNGNLYGNPHRSCAHMHARGRLLATIASDHTVRVFDGPTGERLLRCYRHVGIFNQVALSPDAERFAFTCDTRVEVRCRHSGSLLHEVSSFPFSGGHELTAVAWGDDSTLYVGTEGGALYRVQLDVLQRG